MLKFSIVIAVFNKEKYIARTLESVLAQTHQDFEIVILNDGSTDNSEAEILKFNDPRIRYFSEKNQGAGAARNFAIKEAKNKYIALLDADDYWFPNYLEEHKRLIEKYPEEMVFATASAIKKNDKVFPRTYSINFNNQKDYLINYFESSYRDSVLHSSTIVLKREIFNTVGFYNPAIKSGQDTDLYIRIGLKYNVVFSPKICVHYIFIENSLFRSTKDVSEKLNLDRYIDLEKQNKPLKKFMDLNRYSLCIFAKTRGNRESFQKNFQEINQENLSKKQQFLLRQNRMVLLNLLKTKSSLEKLGLRLGTFK